MPDFRPYVPGVLPTRVYKNQERRGKAWTMWTMWYIFYMHENQLYSVHSNLQVYTGLNASSLSVSHNEAGLHYSGKKGADVSRLLSVWKDEYVSFPNETVRLDWEGYRVK